MAKREGIEGKNNTMSLSKKASFTKSNNSISTKIRKIGNSKGIILNNSMIKKLGVSDDAEVIVMAEKGQITIKPAESKVSINTDISTWEAQFKAAIKNGDQPEADLFNGLENNFDQEEW
ncbi:MAG: AbrB/MazE/SpoVT family DNA-binding domain-containing protein [Segetibacter sp.]